MKTGQAKRVSERARRLAFIACGWTLSAIHAIDARAQIVFNPENGHYYERVLEEGIQWPAADTAAVLRKYGNRTGHLATITSPGEQAFINTHFGDVVGTWLGGFWDASAGSTWRWITGETWSFEAFHPGQPNNLNGNRAYLMLNPTGLVWYDSWEGDTAQGYLIEYPPDTSNPVAGPDFLNVASSGQLYSQTESGQLGGTIGQLVGVRKIGGGGSTGGGFAEASINYFGDITEYADGMLKIELRFVSDCPAEDAGGYMNLSFDLQLPSMRFYRLHSEGNGAYASIVGPGGQLSSSWGTVAQGNLSFFTSFQCVPGGFGKWTLWLSPYAAFVPSSPFTAGNVAGGATPFIASLSAAPTIYDFENFANLTPVDRISPAIDLRLVGPNGAIVAEMGKAFRSSLYNTPGRFSGGALLPESPSGQSGRALLEFDPPVEGVGAWMFDDSSNIANFARLVVTDTLGQKHYTSTIDAKSGTGHGIDGFVGISSKLGIVAAEFESFVATNGAWANNHEIDYLHIGRPLPSASPLQSEPCPGTALTLTANAPGATTYQWRRNGVSISGATQPTLHLNPATGRDTGVYDCRLTGVAGISNSGLSTPAFVKVCAADFACDGQVNDDDFVYFLGAYNVLDCADPSMPTGCPADMNGDAVVDDTDFQNFIVAYEQVACP